MYPFVDICHVFKNLISSITIVSITKPSSLDNDPGNTCLSCAFVTSIAGAYNYV